MLLELRLLTEFPQNNVGNPIYPPLILPSPSLIKNKQRVQLLLKEIPSFINESANVIHTKHTLFFSLNENRLKPYS